MRTLHGWVDDIDLEDEDVFVRVCDPGDDRAADVPLAMFSESERPTLLRGTYIECLVDETDTIIAIKKMVAPVWTQEETDAARRTAKDLSARLLQCF